MARSRPGPATLPPAKPRPAADAPVRPLRPGLAHLSLLGVAAASPTALVAKLEAGLPTSALDRFHAKSGLSWTTLGSWLGLSAGGLARRRATRRRLSPAESDRLVRAARLFQQALDLFDGDAAAVRGWLARPQRGLGGALPIDFARTETGAREVEALLGRLEHGVVA